MDETIGNEEGEKGRGGELGVPIVDTCWRSDIKDL